MSGTPDVFISYASDTKPFAEELSRALESQGIGSWVDFKDLRPGQRWKDELERAVSAAQSFVILLGPDSRAASWQEFEWGKALAQTWTDSEKRLLPVIFGQSNPPAFLQSWVWLTIDPAQDSSTWTKHVIDVLRNIRNASVHASDPRDRAELRKRLEDVGRAVAKLRQAEPDQPPPFTSVVETE